MKRILSDGAGGGGGKSSSYGANNAYRTHSQEILAESKYKMSDVNFSIKTVTNMIGKLTIAVVGSVKLINKLNNSDKDTLKETKSEYLDFKLGPPKAIESDVVDPKNPTGRNPSILNA